MADSLSTAERDDNRRRYEERLASAERVYSHMKVLWDDQVELAETLRERRKAMISVLAIVVGLGVFRAGVADFSRPLALAGWKWDTSRMLITEAVAFFLVGTYLLCSDRQRIRYRLFRLWLVFQAIRKHFKNVRAESDAVKRAALRPDCPALPPRHPHRAIKAILPSPRLQERLQQADPLTVLYVQTAHLRNAYLDLERANNRVHERIREGSALVCAGYVAIAIALVLLLWSI